MAVISRILDSLLSYIGLPLTVIPYKVTQIEFVSPNDILITAICNKMGICGNFLLVIGVTKGESKDWKHLAEIIDG